MDRLLKISLLLCTFGFLRELRPSDSFEIEFLTGEWHNITVDQVNRDFYPLGIYSNLAFLVVVLLITDILRYKPIIVASACAGIGLQSVLLWTDQFWELKLALIFYGFYMASEVAYYTYIYAKVERSKYQRVTGNTRAAMLAGKFFAGILAQLFVSSHLMDYKELHYIALGSQIISLILGLLLPSVMTSVYFYSGEPKKNHSSQAEITLTTLNPTSGGEEIYFEQLTGDTATNCDSVSQYANEKQPLRFSTKYAIHLMKEHIINAYSQPIVLQWSIWWTLATCGQLQIVSYVQFLWKDIDENKESYYNGIVDAVATLMGAGGALAAGFVNRELYQKWHLSILSMCTFIEGGLLIWASLTYHVWTAYILHIFFYIIYFFMVTIASSTVAEHISADSFGLIFGINTLLALGLQCVFIVVVITDSGFNLSIRGQFLAFGGYFVVLAALYGIAAIVKGVKHSQEK